MASSQPEVLSPEWWLNRLYGQLTKRAPHLALMDRYYRGDHPVASLTEKARQGFMRLLRQSRSNYMGLVVDATAERIQVDGFRLGDEETGDKEAWRIWQANGLDARFDMVILEALVGGVAYMCVAPNPQDSKTPLITIEHGSQAIVEYVPGSDRERAAGLKCWLDDWHQLLMATVYLPDGLYKYQAKLPPKGTNTAPRWEQRQVKGEAWPAPNPLKVVSLFEFANHPRMLDGGVSELEDITDIQDRINKTLIDRLMAQEFAAFRQRWVTGYDVPVDDQGQAIEPFKAAVDRLWVAEDSEVKFGEFSATDITPYLKGIESDVQAIAARSRTPSQYLLAGMVNISGDALKAAESGLVSKIKQRLRPMGESLEDVMRLALTSAGGTPDPSMETIWHNPEYRTEGELVDALVKMATIGVPHEALWERWGASQTEITRWQRMQDDSLTRLSAIDLLNASNAPDTGIPGAPGVLGVPGIPPQPVAAGG